MALSAQDSQWINQLRHDVYSGDDYDGGHRGLPGEAPARLRLDTACVDVTVRSRCGRDEVHRGQAVDVVGFCEILAPQRARRFGGEDGSVGPWTGALVMGWFRPLGAAGGGRGDRDLATRCWPAVPRRASPSYFVGPKRGDIRVDVAMASMAAFLFGVLLAFTIVRTRERLALVQDLVAKGNSSLFSIHQMMAVFDEGDRRRIRDLVDAPSDRPDRLPAGRLPPGHALVPRPHRRRVRPRPAGTPGRGRLQGISRPVHRHERRPFPHRGGDGPGAVGRSSGAASCSSCSSWSV